MDIVTQQDDVLPRYATLLYPVRKALNISWAEYVYLDMVYHLSHDGWCYKSLDNVAVDLGLDRSSVFRMQKRLIDKKLLVKNARGHVKSSVLYAKCIQGNKSRMQNATKPYAKRDYSVGETQPKNNNRNTLEKRTEKYKNVSLAEMYKQHLNEKAGNTAKATA